MLVHLVLLQMNLNKNGNKKENTPMEKIIGEIERTETEKIIIQVKEFRGRTYVDFRIHYLADEDEWRPTQKGITVAPALWEEFKNHVEATNDHLNAEGLV